jgi:hypothetical protein
MHDILMFWTTDEADLGPFPLSLLEVPSPREGAPPRCVRCDIPLGSHVCPNPACRAQHGQRAGALCTWCRDQQAAARETWAWGGPDHDARVG